MHVENRITDGFFIIEQNAESFLVIISAFGEEKKRIEESRMLSFDELRALLIQERATMNQEAVANG